MAGGGVRHAAAQEALHKLLEKSPAVVGHHTRAILHLDQNSLKRNEFMSVLVLLI